MNYYILSWQYYISPEEDCTLLPPVWKYLGITVSWCSRTAVALLSSLVFCRDRRQCDHTILCSGRRHPDGGHRDSEVRPGAVKLIFSSLDISYTQEYNFKFLVKISFFLKMFWIPMNPEPDCHRFMLLRM